MTDQAAVPVGRMRRFLRGAMYMAFPSLWISRWAERKHGQIENPALARLVEGLTYRKAYGIDEIQGRVRTLKDARARRLTEQRQRKEEAARLTDEEAYRAMLARHQYTEADRLRGMTRLQTEKRIAQVCMVLGLGCVLGAVYLVSWSMLVMAALSICYTWIKGTQAAFYLWQSERRACSSFKQFLGQGGALKLLEW